MTLALCIIISCSNDEFRKAIEILNNPKLKALTGKISRSYNKVY